MTADIAFRPPPPHRMKLAMAALEPWRRFTRPVFVGLDRFPAQRPLLLVGNHTLMGVLDAPLLFAELWEQKGIFVRSLGDHAHFKVPLWRDFLRRYGVVDGTPANCAALLEHGEAVMLFPGGAREVAKRRGERYRLLWGRRAGFARLAVEHNALIVPFGEVGVDDAFDIVWDANDLMQTPLGGLIRRYGLRTDFIPPLVKGVGPTPLPRPHRYYFSIGEPIEPHAFATDPADAAGVWKLREAARHGVERCIHELLELRDVDPDRVRLPLVFDDPSRVRAFSR